MIFLRKKTMEETIRKEVARQTAAVKKEMSEFRKYILDEMRRESAPEPKKEETPLGGLFAKGHTCREGMIYLSSLWKILKEQDMNFPRGAVQRAARDLKVAIKIAPNNFGRTAGYEMISKADAEKVVRYMEKNYKN